MRKLSGRLSRLMIFLSFFLGQITYAEELMSLGNLRDPAIEDNGQAFMPGEFIILPSGDVAYIEEELSDGNLKASNGIIITPNGKMRSSNESVKIYKQTQLEVGARVKLPDEAEDIITEKLPDGGFRSKSGIELSSDGKIKLKFDFVETFEEAEEILAKTGAANHAEESAARQDGVSIADMLAFNEPVKTEKKAAKQEKREKDSKNAYGERKGEKKESKSAFKTKKGDKLMIPSGAAAKKDYSFLKGCWRSNSLTYYHGFIPYKAPAELCFGGGSNGTFNSYLPRNEGGICKANASARFSSGRLMIQTQLGPCQNRKVSAGTMPRVFQCEGADEKTECYILAKDHSDRRRKFKSKALFYKK